MGDWRYSTAGSVPTSQAAQVEFPKRRTMAPVSLEKVTKIYPNGFKAVEELDLGRRRW